MDVNRLIIKYNIDSKQAVLPELKNALKEIETLLRVIRDIVELPLCEECRYYTKEKVGDGVKRDGIENGHLEATTREVSEGVPLH